MRTQTWQHAGRHVSALVSEIPKRNGWTIAPQAGDRTPDRTQRLLNRAVWDGAAAMSGARRFVVTGLDAVAGRRARRGLRIAALDETGQQKAGTATCGIRQTMSRAEPARGHGADVESVLPPAVVEVGRNRGGVDDCATLEARMNEQQTAWQAIGDTHRSEWAVLVASATRVAGDRDLAEECVQDAYARAVALWPAQGVPANPAAWLTTVARRCALDLHRHAQTANRLAPLAARADVVPGPDDIVAGPAVGHRIRLLGVCGHPSLGESAQLALTLRLLGGLSAAQVGRVLGVGEATVAARLTRAKKTIAMVRTSPDELHPDGVAPVLTAVHAMFNTGHNTIHDTDPIPVGLSPRSLHLARLLASLLPGDREVRGLLAWILLTDARTPARAACRDRLPLLAEQDRSRWDRAKLREGLALARTLRPARGRFAVMAQLAAVHAEAPTWQHTDWHRVSRLYGRLRQVWTHPVLAIHQAVAVGLADGPEAGLTRLPADQLIDAYLSAARGDMLYRLGHTADAAIAYRFAAAAADNPYEQRLLADRGHDMDRAARTTPVPFAPVEVLPAFPTTGRTR